MDDIWGSFDETEPGQSPDTIRFQYQINQDTILEQTNRLRTALDCSAQVVVAAYKVADYVPNLRDSTSREFWEKQIIPILVQSLDQDVKVRSIVIESFCTIHVLTIAIKQGAKLVELSKGSSATIAAAQRTIGDARIELDKRIAKAESLNSSAIDEYFRQISLLLQIMHPEAANYTQHKIEIENLLKLQYEKEQKLYADFAHKKARIKKNQDQEAFKKKVTQDLQEYFCHYKGEYKRLARELQEDEKTLFEKLAPIQREIISLNDRLIDLDKAATDATNMYGHQGNALVQCLTEIRTLAKAINYGTTVYAPLVNILTTVKVLVGIHIEIFMSEDSMDIFLGAKALLRQVECLEHYYTCASECMEPPKEYRDLEVTTEMKAGEI